MDKKQSSEDYLETILILSKSNKEIHAKDIVKSMNFSKPSVSIALKKLESEGSIIVDKKTSHIFLTKKGEKIAEKVYEKHEVLTRILNKHLKVDKKTAEEDACKIEHLISEETFKKLKKYFHE